jgi:hypothetical protein
MPILSGVSSGSISSLREERYALGHASALAAVSGNQLPKNFPTNLWSLQAQRYEKYWAWYDGKELDETLAVRSEDGTPILLFPLQMNAVRNFADKHASVALGEGEDTHLPHIRPVCTPVKPITGGDATSEVKELTEVARTILEEIWSQSGGRSIQQQSMKLSQFLGGAVLKAAWKPDRKDLRLPGYLRRLIYWDSEKLGVDQNADRP